MIIWRRLRFSKTALRIFLIFSPVVVLNMIFQNPKTISHQKFHTIFKKIYGNAKNTFLRIINEPEFFRKNRRARFLLL